MKPEDFLYIAKHLSVEIFSASIFVDFLQLYSSDKRLIRSYISPHLISLATLQLEKILPSYLKFYIEDSGYFFISDSYKAIQKAAIIDSAPYSHELEFGLLLGYPKCCSLYGERTGEGLIDSVVANRNTYLYEEEFQKINIDSYLSGHALICHVPCSYSCQDSLTLANAAYSFLEDLGVVVDTNLVWLPFIKN